MAGFLAFLVVLAGVAIIGTLCYRFTTAYKSLTKWRKYQHAEFDRLNLLVLRIERLCSEYADTQPELSYIIKSEITNDYRKREL